MEGEEGKKGGETIRNDMHVHVCMRGLVHKTAIQ